jgi:Cu/Ag efflux pump CusA
MMRWIVGSSLKFRVIVVALAAGLMGLGVVQLRDTPVDVFPEFAPPRVEIQTPCLGLSATDVEALVTVPLEHALQGLAGLDALRSKSVQQLSSIQLIFKQGTDLLKARQRVSERVNTVIPTLPTWAAPPVMLQPLSSTSRVMKIGLSSDTRSLIEMSMISYWTIRARLLRVPGVANVAPGWPGHLHAAEPVRRTTAVPAHRGIPTPVGRSREARPRTRAARGLKDGKNHVEDSG